MSRQPLVKLGVVPNVLSVGRLLLAAAFPIVPGPWLAPIIVAAGLSDFIDGYLARRFNLSSWVGGLLDAIADKVFVLTVLVTLTYRRQLEIEQAMLLLSRDFAVLFVVIYAVLTARWDAFRRMPSRPFGKVTTVLVMVLFLVLVLWPALGALGFTLLALAAAMSIIAALDYLRLFIRGLREPRA